MRITLQFHGDRQEIFLMALGWARELGMSLVEERFFPDYQVQLVSGTDMGGEGVRCSDGIDRISLSSTPADLGAKSSLEYSKRNPDSLFVTLGEQSDKILRESFLAGVTDEAELAKIWRRLRQRAAKDMYKGVWLENSMSGARSRVASHYYTDEAKRLATAGVVPLGGTDWLRYHFD